ncbi:glutamate synthase large subunit [Prochlorothrix hollandica]
MTMNSKHTVPAANVPAGFPGQPWLVEERDACGVGFIADQQGHPSHDLVQKALIGLGCMEHRGGCSADRDSGDGSGILCGIPWDLLGAELALDPTAIAAERVALGMFFLPQDEQQRHICIAATEAETAHLGLTFLTWRSVPINPDVLGTQARANQPHMAQCLILSSDRSGDDLEQVLFRLRRRIGNTVSETFAAQGFSAQRDDFYPCSLSCRTVVYKGMVRGEVLGQFYQDLQNPAFTSVFAVYHRRFSTNTLPKWPLAQPMRLLGHNGEINTLLGNINWMRARQSSLSHPLWGETIADLLPIVKLDNSDSATLDNVAELLVRSGRSPMETLMIMVPEAFRNQPDLADHPEITDFYEYYNGIQEPWDGPALLAFSDGKVVGATLDRNGLRPARYTITASGYITVASEAGVVDLEPETVIEKGRLGPGQMIAFDLRSHQILKNWDLKQTIAQAQPYGTWLQAHQHPISSQGFPTAPSLSSETLLTHQSAFGYTAEDVDMVIETMASQGKEPTFCMGDDIPLAVLSAKPHLLYDYFKQRFAQVTNPAIDPLRENLVMSLRVRLGQQYNLLQPGEVDARKIALESPILNETELALIQGSPFSTTTLSTLYPLSAGPEGLQGAVDNLCAAAAAAIAAGHEILVLSDRADTGINADTTYIPPLMAVGAVHHYLIHAGLRLKASLVVDTAQCWSTHHFACLLGYGANAVLPYLALETVRQWWHLPRTQTLMTRDKLPQVTLEEAQVNFRKAVEAGLFKILSKMGISLLASYQAAQVFEAIGIGTDLLELAFKGTASRLGGLRIVDLAQETLGFHASAFPELNRQKLDNLGFIQYRPGGEYHMNSPEMSKALHKAIKNGRNIDHYSLYKTYLQDRPVTALRDLLTFGGDRPPLALEEVEPVESIVARFCTGGMSLGALSREAHETLAIAMNRLGGKSNSGEGGEDPVRYTVLDHVDSEGNSAVLPHLHGLRNGDTANSAIKQVASGRFGVTPEYLMSAQQIEIKVSQGAKPGEGGQLPGTKVSAYIAFLRNAKAGVPLISPPPHHDIYSIEDLAQLIFDLHQINPQARVSVKLVSEVGIGTVAAGVAKANADIIQISGHDGGTGASPLSSIKHAGSPWELGLTEVHRALMDNQLRDRVLLRVDGGLKTGWDVVMGALMGAEEFGFGSIAMIAEGCIMARICHTNNCPVGVATQQEKLRLRFTGVPDHVVNFFYLIGEEVRSILASLGYRQLADITGRADLLAVRPDVQLTKTPGLNLDCLTQLPDTRHDRTWLDHGEVHGNGPVLDDEILADPQLQETIASHGTYQRSYPVVNTDRSLGARLAGFIAQRYGNHGFKGQIALTFQGSVGQSFGALNLDGVSLHLEGEANDYVGKSMNGGEIVIKPPAAATFDPAHNVILGNTCLYGATGGVLFAQGQAGERFGVRNSKGQAVVEGTGDHCCEYMTGGVIVVLGRVGRNVGAGMTGGLAYVLDELGNFPDRVNREIVAVQRVRTAAGEAQLKALIQAHGDRTGSPKAQAILADWATYLPQFWQVVPPSESGSPEANPQATVDSANAALASV